MPSACTDTDRAGYERAHAGATSGTAVLLPGGVSISTCTRRVRTDAELQNLGSVVHAVAEDLAARARDGSVDAARSLGYLSAAVAAGADDSNGISAELSRRVENTGVGVREAGASVAHALDVGLDAGRASG
jgi:hypothetical protein